MKSDLNHIKPLFEYSWQYAGKSLADIWLCFRNIMRKIKTKLPSFEDNEVKHVWNAKVKSFNKVFSAIVAIFFTKMMHVNDRWLVGSGIQKTMHGKSTSDVNKT